VDAHVSTEKSAPQGAYDALATDTLTLGDATFIHQHVVQRAHMMLARRSRTWPISGCPRHAGH
jgi:hypothetical protein